MQLLYKTQPSSKKDSPRTSDKLPPTMARHEKSLAVCLEILQDYTAKDFSLFAVLTTADFCAISGTNFIHSLDFES